MSERQVEYKGHRIEYVEHKESYRIYDPLYAEQTIAYEDSVEEAKHGIDEQCEDITERMKILIDVKRKYVELKSMLPTVVLNRTDSEELVKEMSSLVNGKTHMSWGGENTVTVEGYVPMATGDKWTYINYISLRDKGHQRGDLTRFLEDLTMGYYSSLCTREIAYTPNLIRFLERELEFDKRQKGQAR